MDNLRKIIQYNMAWFILFCLTSTDANAFQTHGNPEGLYVHQAAHLLFAISCALLYRQMEQSAFLKKRRLASHWEWDLVAVSLECLDHHRPHHRRTPAQRQYLKGT